MKDDHVAKVSYSKTDLEEGLKPIIDFVFKDKMQAEKIKDVAFLNTVSYLENEIKTRGANLDSSVLDNILKWANANILNAKYIGERAKAELICDALRNIHLFPQSLRNYIYRAIFTPGDKQPGDEILDDDIREILKEHRQAEANKAKAEAEKSKAEADREREKVEQEKWANKKERDGVPSDIK